MVDEKAVGFVVQLAVMAQCGRHHFAFFPGIDENQTLFAPGMLEDIPNAGVCVGRGVVGFFFQHRQCAGNLLILRGLSVLDVEMLHAQPPFAALGVDFRDDGLPPRPQRQEFAGSLRVTDGGRQSDTPGIDSRNSGQPLDEAQRLPAPVAPQEGMHLVNDHKPQVAEQLCNGRVLVQKQRFQRFRRDLENAGGVAHELRLMALGNVPVPVPHRDIRFGAQVVQPGKLVVDQRFQRANIDAAHAGGHILGKQGDDGEERRFRLSGSGGGGKQHIFIRVENGVRRRDLNGAQIFPVILIDIFLHKGRVSVKCTHIQPPYSSNSARESSVCSSFTAFWA